MFASWKPRSVFSSAHVLKTYTSASNTVVYGPGLQLELPYTMALHPTSSAFMYTRWIPFSYRYNVLTPFISVAQPDREWFMLQLYLMCRGAHSISYVIKSMRLRPLAPPYGGSVGGPQANTFLHSDTQRSVTGMHFSLKTQNSWSEIMYSS
jgi:hypothetical protein